MMRAYGDRDLFTRFKWRFIFAPIFLASICGLSAWRGYTGVELLLLFWGVWHSLVQTYGFMRIYDAKVKSFAARTSRLDRAMCTVWFVGGALFTDSMTANLLIGFYNSGGPLMPPLAIFVVRVIWTAVAAVITGLFLANFFATWRGGQRQNIVKLALLAVTIVYWWFCMTSFDRLIIGLAMFEFFHDTQYLAIVWLFNRNRVDKDANVGSFTRFLFRRNGLLMILYVGLTLTYGFVYRVVEHFPQNQIKEVLLGVLMASTFLHYYYDGFIWRVREKSTRDSLGVAPKQANGAARQPNAPRLAGGSSLLKHGAYWCVFVGPLLGLTVAQAIAERSGRSEIEWRRRIVETVPNVARSQMALAELLVAEAKTHDQNAARLRAQGESTAGQQEQMRLARESREQAAHHFQRSLETWPDNEIAHNKLGLVLMDLGRNAEAIVHFNLSLKFKPAHTMARLNLANLILAEGKLDKAIEQYQMIIAKDPRNPKAHYNLANVYVKRRQVDDAFRHYRLAIEANPRYAHAYFNLGNLYASTDQFDLAIAQFRKTLQLQPNHTKAKQRLARISHKLRREAA